MDASDLVDEEAEKELDEDKELIETIYKQVTKGTTPKSQRSTARDEMLRKEQQNISVKGMTVKQLSEIKPKERKIENDQKI